MRMPHRWTNKWCSPVLLPTSSFEDLIRRHIEYPMMFRITNNAQNRTTHCSVLEFTAEEGRCYIPHWVRAVLPWRCRRGRVSADDPVALRPQMMESLLLQEGSMVTIVNVSLPGATFCKFRPHSKDFLDIADQRAVYVARAALLATLRAS